MASAIVRTALRGCALSPRASTVSKRSFASSSSHQDEAAEAAKWKKISIVGMTVCTLYSFNVLSKGHPHHETPPPYPYLHIRAKEFPWGPDGLFEKKNH